MGDGLRRCAVCRSETSVTAGTIFAGTRTPLVSWFAAGLVRGQPEAGVCRRGPPAQRNGVAQASVPPHPQRGEAEPIALNEWTRTVGRTRPAETELSILVLVVRLRPGIDGARCPHRRPRHRLVSSLAAALAFPACSTVSVARAPRPRGLAGGGPPQDSAGPGGEDARLAAMAPRRCLPRSVGRLGRALGVPVRMRRGSGHPATSPIVFEAAESRSCASRRNCSFQTTALALQWAQPTSVRSCGCDGDDGERGSGRPRDVERVGKRRIAFAGRLVGDQHALPLSALASWRPLERAVVGGFRQHAVGVPPLDLDERADARLSFRPRFARVAH